ncbi:MAG TPA: HAMP domain-containing sensor histidine kinase [Gemmatimonadaceae bacterium]|nr:HAMP domain-containing sensor histidine kinase [Gemmatimonadaceae bacterium]
MSTRPSAFQLRWPLFVLMASIGLTAFAAFDAQRAVRGQTAVVNRAISELSSFAAWSYSEHLKQQLSASAVEVVGAVNHGGNMHTNPGVPDAEDLVHYLPNDIACECHRTRAGPSPENFFGFKIGTRDVDVAANLYPEPAAGWRVDPTAGHDMPEPMSKSMSMMMTMPSPRPQGDYRWIADTLTYLARSGIRDEHGYGIVIAHPNGRMTPVTYTLMPTAWGDTMVYGVTYTPGAFTGTLQRVLDDKGLLPATFTRGATNRDVVALRVLDASGKPIFESLPGASSRVTNRLALPPEYGALILQVMVRPDQASNLIIGGVPRSRLPFLLGLLALAAIMSVVAIVQIRRETELAGMRADFVSSISHELRTPLAQIKLYLETLRLGRASTPEQRDWSLRHIDRETTRLGNLVENVLRFSRLGRPDEMPAEPVDVVAEVEKIVNEFRPLAASRKCSIDLTVSAHPLARIKPDALQHAIVNLLDNAVKYGPASQTISVAIGMTGGNAVISVSDEGAGVSPADRESIWRAFARAKTATGAAGSGIGLTIVRDVMLQNGGKAWVEDAPGGGARFVLSFPAEGVVSDTEVPATQVDQTPAGVG